MKNWPAYLACMSLMIGAGLAAPAGAQERGGDLIMDTGGTDATAGTPDENGEDTESKLGDKLVPDAPPRIRSLFYTSTETSELRLAINTYIKNTTGRGDDLTVDEEDFLRQLTGLKRNGAGGGRKDANGKEIVAGGPGEKGGKGGKPGAPEEIFEPKSYTYPQFYLSSVVYHGPDDWVIWVNGRRLGPSPLPDPEGLKVLELMRDKVKLQWRPQYMNKVIEVWDKMPRHDESITIERAQGLVIFNLRMNQTFTSYAMRTVEGKLEPVTIENNGKTIVKLNAPDDGSLNAPLPKNTPPKKQPPRKPK